MYKNKPQNNQIPVHYFYEWIKYNEAGDKPYLTFQQFIAAKKVKRDSNPISII